MINLLHDIHNELGSVTLREFKIYLPYIAAIIYSLIFGLSFMFTKQALDNMPPILLLSYRFLAAALVLTVLALFRIIKLDYKKKPLGKLFLLTFFQPIAYFTFETIGIKLTSSSEAGIMIALIPVVVTVLAAVFLKERVTFFQLVFIISSVAGVIFIVLMSGDLTMDGHMAGIAALMGAVLSAGVYNILSRKLSDDFTPVELTFAMMWTGAIVFNIIALTSFIIDNNLEQYTASLFSADNVIPILYLGVLSSVCAFLMINYVLSKLSASVSSVFNNLTTVISIIAGVLIRNETFYWYQMAGSILIILGVWGTNHFASQCKNNEEFTHN